MGELPRFSRGPVSLPSSEKHATPNLVYTESVEIKEWAKAHFFIAEVDDGTMPDTSRQAVAARVAEIAERVADSAGLEIVDIQLLGGGKARVLRIYIDKPEGVSHNDCELISDRVGAILDAEDVIPGEGYTLEVSSPGVERKLSKPKDFERFTGKKAKFVLREPVDNQRQWVGTLVGFSDGVISLEPAAGKLIHFPLAQVEKANLKFEW